jgi:hypothetical protein
VSSRLLGIPVHESSFMPVIRWVRRDSGDARNPYPRFGLRPLPVREQIDVVLFGPGGMAVSPRVLGMITDLGHPHGASDSAEQEGA